MCCTRVPFSGALIGICASFLIAPAASFAADKDVIELQRQMAILSDRVNSLQTSLTALQTGVTEKLAAQGTLLQQTLDAVNQMQSANAAASKSLAEVLNQQQEKITVPVAALNARLDQMIQSISAAQDNISDMSTRLGKLEQRLVDLENLVKVLQPPVPQAPQTPGGPPPGVTAQGLSQDASRDQLSGKSDLALQEYSQYLKYFGDTESAANAQFQIGEIQYQDGNYDQAIQAFDLVAGQFPMSAKAPEALYEKAQVLKKQGHRTQANQVLSQLVRQYPDSDAAGRAKTDLAPAPRK
jgi:tol-pal system protein YbgF